MTRNSSWEELSRFADNLKVSSKEAVLVGVPLITGVILIITLLVLLDMSEQEVRQEARGKEFFNCATNFHQAFSGMVASSITYAYTKQEIYKTQFYRTFQDSKESFELISDLTDHDPEQLKILAQLKVLWERMFHHMLILVDDAPESLNKYEILKVPEIRQQMEHDLIKYHILDGRLLAVHEARQRAQRNMPLRIGKEIKQLVFVLVLLTGAISAGLAWYVCGNMVKRLGYVMKNAARLAAHAPLHPALRGKDEIAKLDSIFHRVADTLHATTLRERALIENAVDVICSLDANLRLKEISPSCETLWGYKPEELIGTMLIDIVCPDDVDLTVTALKANVMDQDMQLVNRIARKDGSYLEGLWSFKWSQQDTCFCVVHDITQRKVAEELLRESEQRLRLMIECLPLALFIANWSGRIEVANLQARRTFAWSLEADNDLCLPAMFAQLAEGTDGTDEKLMQIIHTRLVGRVSELELTRADYSTFYAQISMTIVQMSGEKKLLSVVSDMSEQHAMAQFKQDFVAMVSDDLRTPLTSLNELLNNFDEGQFGSLTSAGKSFVARSKSDLIRLIALIDDLLDAEKMKAGKLQVNVDLLDMHSVVVHAVNAIHFLADRNEIGLQIPEQSLMAVCDGPKIIQVVVNLLSNAIKFSPRGSTIVVDYRNVDDFVEVRVIDLGRGIPASRLSAIFEKFEQVEVADYHEKGGKGLGLAICQSIIQAHEGSIGVESEEGTGSTFWFRLPQLQEGAPT